MYTPLAVANAAVSHGARRSPMGLNKLVHAIHGWSLAYGRTIVGELPALLRYGPVYVSLHETLMKFGNETVNGPQPILHGISVPTIPGSDLFALELIAHVCRAHAHLSDLEMSSLMHGDGTPWKNEAAAHDFVVKKGTVVPEWRIRDHYLAKLGGREADVAA